MPRPEQPELFAHAPLPVAPLDDAQRLACLRLIRSENVGPATFRALINHYGGASAALAALPEIARRGGRTIRICPVAEAEAELSTARKIGAIPLFTIEPGYPAALAVLDNVPPLIYAKGRIELLNRPSLAVIGSRRASAAGLKLARLLAAGAGGEDIAVVSGLARGIDAAAHEASLATGTIAVLAGGLDVIYPPEHAQLQQRISEIGCLVTERPPGLIPRGRDFPRRNRLISGISYAVLVIEAARRSGTLITARFAIEQGRDVMAVPGHPLDPRAEGTNDLLKKGAVLVTEIADIVAAFAPLRQQPPVAPPHGLAENQNLGGPLSSYGTSGPVGDGDPARSAPSRTATGSVALGAYPPSPKPDANEDPPELRILSVLGPAPVTIDEIARATGLAIQTVQGVLLELALSGRIEQHGSQLVSLRVHTPHETDPDQGS